MRIYLTYCSANKRSDSQMLPARERYISQRILHVEKSAQLDGFPLYIFSGEFGLIAASDNIPWYDHLLQENEVEHMVAKMEMQIPKEITSIVFFSSSPEIDNQLRPYHRVIKKACMKRSISLEIRFLDFPD